MDLVKHLRKILEDVFPSMEFLIWPPAMRWTFLPSNVLKECGCLCLVWLIKLSDISCNYGMWGQRCLKGQKLIWIVEFEVWEFICRVWLKILPVSVPFVIIVLWGKRCLKGQNLPWGVGFEVRTREKSENSFVWSHWRYYQILL